MNTDRVIYEAKQRSFTKPCGMFGSFAMFEQVIEIGAVGRDFVRAVIFDNDLPLSIVAPFRARHPLFGNEQHDGCCGDEDKRVITLPTFARLTADDQRRVVDALAYALDGVRDRTPSASAGPRQMTLG